MLSTLVPMEIDGRIDMPKVMRWLRENGLEFVDIVVMSDNEAALTSLIGPWSTMRAMRSGSRMIIETTFVGSSKSNGMVERSDSTCAGE